MAYVPMFPALGRPGGGGGGTLFAMIKSPQRRRRTPTRAGHLHTRRYETPTRAPTTPCKFSCNRHTDYATGRRRAARTTRTHHARPLNSSCGWGHKTHTKLGGEGVTPNTTLAMIPGFIHVGDSLSMTLDTYRQPTIHIHTTERRGHSILPTTLYVLSSDRPHHPHETHATALLHSNKTVDHP